MPANLAELVVKPVKAQAAVVDALHLPDPGTVRPARLAGGTS